MSLSRSITNAVTTGLIGAGGLRRLLKPKVVVWGDSYAQIGLKDQGTAYVAGTELDHQFQMQGIVNQARLLSLGALSGSLALNDNYGVGNTATPNQTANQLAAVLAARPAISIWHGGTNDPLASNTDATAYTLAQTKAAVLTAVQAHAAIGALLVIFSIPPRGGVSAAVRQAHAAINNFYRTLPLLYPHVVLVDYARYWVDHSSATGDPLGGNGGAVTGLTYDGVHPTPKAAYIAGALLWDALRPSVADRWPCETVGVTNAFDPALNPGGNLSSTIGDMLGTAGTFGSDTTVTGTIASNIVIRNYANGLPVTCSKGVGTAKYAGSPFTTQRLVIGQSGTGMKQVFIQGPYVPVGSTGVSLAIGDKLGAACFARFNSVTGLFAAQLGLVETGASGVVQQNADGFPLSTGGSYYPAAPYPVGQEAVLEVPPLTVSSLVTTGVRPMVTVWVDAAVSTVDLEFGAFNTWKITS